MNRATMVAKRAAGIVAVLWLSLGLLAMAPAVGADAKAYAQGVEASLVATASSAKGTLTAQGSSLTAQAMTASDYWSKVYTFVKDSRWKDGVSWGKTHTQYSNYDASQCLGYCCDFTKWVYGVDDCRAGTPFYSLSEVRSGDVLYHSGHWFVVLERNGSELWTAEGNYLIGGVGYARVKDPGYRIKNGTIYQVWYGDSGAREYAKTFVKGYHFDTGGATLRGKSAWWQGETIKDLGSDFYANLILRTTWVGATVDPSTGYVVNADTSKTGRDPDHWATFWHFVRNSDGSYRILNSYYDNRPLQASGTTSGSRIILGSSYTGANNQKWFIYHESGQYIMRSAASDFVVNVDNASADPGAKWQVWTYTDYATERLSIYKQDPAQASTFSVKAGTSSEPTVVSWNKLASGLTAWYNVRIGTLDADGNIITPYYNTDYVDSATTSQEVQLPAGNYRAWVQTCSYFNYKPSNTVDFTVGVGDTQAPTLTNVKVAEITDEYVKITAQAKDNVGIVKSMTVNGAVYKGLKAFSYIEVGEPGSGDYRFWWGQVLSTDNLGDTAQKSIALELTLYTPKGAQAANLVNQARDYLWPGHHRLVLTVRDTSQNASEPVQLEFDVPFADSSDTVSMAVGETKSLEDIFGSGVETYPSLYDGGQTIIAISKADTPYTFTGKTAGSCVIMAGNQSSGGVAVKRIVVTDGGSATDDAAVQQVMAAIDAVNALPAADVVTLDDEAVIEAARAKYDAVVNNDGLFALMSSVSYRDTNAKLEAVEQALANLEAAAEEEAAAQAAREADRAAAQAAIAAVNALPAAGDVTLDHASAIHAAEDVLNALTDEQMEYVSASDWRAASSKLAAVLDKLYELESEQAAREADQLEADSACALVGALPEASALTLANADVVNEAEVAFESLTDEQIDLIPAFTYRQLSQKLQTAKDKVAELEAAASGDPEGPNPDNPTPDDPSKTDINTVEASLNKVEYTYNGLKFTPAVMVVGLTEGADYTVSYRDNRNAGIGKVDIVGQGNYKGTKTLTFAIKQALLDKTFVHTGYRTQIYTGKAITPYGFISYHDLSDYTVSYRDNVNIGTGYIVFTGAGNYAGKVEVPFQIIPGKVALKKPKTAKKKATVKWGAVKGGVQYQVQYRKGKGAWKTKTTAKTKIVLKKLKSKKKYQVQVRAYKVVGGKAYYGGWSNTKTVKVK